MIFDSAKCKIHYGKDNTTAQALAMHKRDNSDEVKRLEK